MKLRLPEGVEHPSHLISRGPSLPRLIVKGWWWWWWWAFPIPATATMHAFGSSRRSGTSALWLPRPPHTSCCGYRYDRSTGYQEHIGTCSLGADEANCMQCVKKRPNPIVHASLGAADSPRKRCLRLRFIQYPLGTRLDTCSSN